MLDNVPLVVVEVGVLVGLLAVALVLSLIFIKYGAPLIDDLMLKLRQDAPTIKKHVADAASRSAQRVKQINRTAGEKARAATSPWVSEDGARLKKYEQLERLGALRQAGVLTEEEFQGEKARILQERSD